MLNKIEVGQIWQVCTEDFWSSGEHQKIDGRKVAMNLKNGEYIEIRFPYDWHFRTVDDKYDHATEKEILKNCRLIGHIFENTRRANNKKLQSILSENLYKPIWEK